MLYNMAVAREQAGICLANTHLTIVLAAYLYAALRSKGALISRWKAMDEVIDTHMSALFFGSIPTDPIKMHKVWSLRGGWHPTQLRDGAVFRATILGGDRTGKLPLKAARTSCLSISDTTHVLGEWLAGKRMLLGVVHSASKQMTSNDTK